VTCLTWTVVAVVGAAVAETDARRVAEARLLRDVAVQQVLETQRVAVDLHAAASVVLPLTASPGRRTARLGALHHRQRQQQQQQQRQLLLLLLLLTLSLLGFLAAGPTVRRCLLGRCRSHGARVHRRNHWLPVTVRLRAILKTAVLKNRICGRFKLRSASAGWIQLPGLQTSAG